MYQLELVFRLLVRLQFLYFQYNVYLNEELAYKRGVARPNNMWLNLVKMAGRLSVAPSLSWLLSIFI